MAKSSSSHRKKRDKVSSKVLFFIHPVLGLGFSCSSSHGFCLFVCLFVYKICFFCFPLLEYSVWILRINICKNKIENFRQHFKLKI